MVASLNSQTFSPTKKARQPWRQGIKSQVYRLLGQILSNQQGHPTMKPASKPYKRAGLIVIFSKVPSSSDGQPQPSRSVPEKAGVSRPVMPEGALVISRLHFSHHVGSMVRRNDRNDTRLERDNHQTVRF